MRWYERLYVGEQARKKRYRLIRAVEKRKKTGYYVLLPSDGPERVLELIPAASFSRDFYQKGDFLIVGLAADFDDAVLLAGRIIGETYRETGGFDVKAYLEEKR